MPCVQLQDHRTQVVHAWQVSTKKKTHFDWRARRFTHLLAKQYTPLRWEGSTPGVAFGRASKARRLTNVSLRWGCRQEPMRGGRLLRPSRAPPEVMPPVNCSRGQGSRYSALLPRHPSLSSRPSGKPSLPPEGRKACLEVTSRGTSFRMPDSGRKPDGYLDTCQIGSDSIR